MTKNNNPSSISGIAAPGFSPNMLLILFAIFTGCFLLTINILFKIGLSQSIVYALVSAIPASVFIGVGTTLRISSPGGAGGFSRFQHAPGSFGVVHSAMAGTSEWLSLFLLIGMISAFSNTNHDGLAMVSGVFCGLAFASLFLLPKMSSKHLSSPTVTVTGFFSPAKNDREPAKKLFRLALAIVVISCAFMFLVAQIGAGSQILKFHFPIPDHWAALCILLPVLLTIMTGGMRSLTLANMLLFCLIGTAVLLPAIWLSQTITANVIPQMSYGTGALQPIRLLESQLAESITGNSELIFNQGNFSTLTGVWDFVATFFVMMTGSAALPLLYTRVAGQGNSAARTRSIGWTLLFLALVLSFIPPFVTFMKFEIYRDLVGLPIGQLGENVGWLYNWAALEGGHHALVCGEPATSVGAMISACNGGADHVLLPSDLQFSPLMTFLGAGEIADMPLIFSALAYAGILSAAATTIAIALMVIINTIDNELLPARTSNSTLPIAQRLFVSRLMLIMICTAGIWVAQSVPVPVTDFSLWGFAISAGAIFPVMIMIIWWPHTNGVGALAGLVSGILVSGYLLLTMEYGPDGIAQNGDELVWNYPFSQEALSPLTGAIVGMLAAVAVLIAGSLIKIAAENYQTK